MRSVIANWAGLGVNALLSLVMTPILLHGLGNLYFGMYMLVASVLDSCGLLDFGMRTASFRFLARHYGSGEREELDRTFASGMVITCCSAVLILLAALAAVFLLPRFFAVSAADRPVFRELILLLGGSVAAAFLSQILGTYLCAFRRFDFYNLNSAGDRNSAHRTHRGCPAPGRTRACRSHDHARLLAAFARKLVVPGAHRRSGDRLLFAKYLPPAHRRIAGL